MNKSMEMSTGVKEKLASVGFAIIEDVFTNEETNSILQLISQADTSNPVFRKTSDLFAIRQFLKEIHGTSRLIFTRNLISLISSIARTDYFVVKSIYFDKPADSNWSVAWHQDLTISVDTKMDIEGFGPWTTKQNQYGVQPPLHILEDNVTLRIHLDDTDEENGALKVIPGSHLKGIYRPEMIDMTKETAYSCNVKKGGIMIMKPLLLHASGKTKNNHTRRVIHIEFSRSKLPDGLQWAEYLSIRSLPFHQTR
jgi:ectoine hydroxylase-related dioxygenase (phytanoyl-CoA dioxygenase family)